MKDSNEDDGERVDLGDVIGDILEGTFGVFRHTVETVSKVVQNMVIKKKSISTSFTNIFSLL